MAYVTVTIAAGSGDTVKQALDKLWGNTQALRSCEIGTSPPASPVDGMVWVDNTSSTQYIVKLYQDGAWIVLTDKVAEGDRDFGHFEALNFRLENLATGALTPPSSGVKGLVEYDTTLDLLKVTGPAVSHYAAQARIDASTERRIPCALNVAGLGTPATASVATALGGWLLDAAGEEINVVALMPVPEGWTGADDLALEIEVLLAAAETAGDDIDLDGTWRSITSGADAATKTATGLAAIAHDIGSGNAQYTRHKVRLVIDHDDGTNPVAAGDLIGATLTRDGLANVAGVIVVAASLVVPVFNFDD